jgi:hypothetical protein
LRKEIILNLNLTSKQFDILFENNFSTYWNPEILDANKNIIEQYKQLKNEQYN